MAKKIQVGRIQSICTLETPFVIFPSALLISDQVTRTPDHPISDHSCANFFVANRDTFGLNADGQGFMKFANALQIDTQACQKVQSVIVFAQRVGEFQTAFDRIWGGETNPQTDAVKQRWTAFL